ncbi:MAG: DUF177 domain-containing protein [Deltaproteobacteria bacterium]|nr:DUF177 domain-containing protein [Deltaproteobacteria bacterium]
MIIDLKDISESPQVFEFRLEEDWWVPDGPSDQIRGLSRPLEVSLSIYRAGGRFVLEGSLSEGVLARCDRCLERYSLDTRSSFKVFLERPPAGAEGEEIELKEEDMEVDFIRGEELDLDEIIREQIYLSLPMKSLCSEDCRGLCPGCGCNLNVERCRCRVRQGHPAFQKLKELNIY